MPSIAAGRLEKTFFCVKCVSGVFDVIARCVLGDYEIVSVCFWGRLRIGFVQSKLPSRSFAFPSMNRDQRRVVHELAEVYRCDTQSYDHEPNKNVVATANRYHCAVSIYFPCLFVSVCYSMMEREQVLI